MMKMNRTAIPNCLSAIHTHKYKGTNYPKWKHWGFMFAEKNDASKFDWHNTREMLSQELQTITDYHCCFCDSYPLGTGAIKDTIEHFRPKHLFPLLAYYWGNLFLCCHYCQEIPQDWDNQNIKWVLKPDQENYTFNKYFYFDSNSGYIKVNPYATSEDDKRKASLTIKYYKLNDYARPQARLDAFKLYQNESNINKKQYRFMFL